MPMEESSPDEESEEEYNAPRNTDDYELPEHPLRRTY